MSRIGKRKLTIPDGVTVTQENDAITVKGPKGELTEKINKAIKVTIEGNEIKIERENDSIPTRALHGTTNANLKNMIEGVSKGYSKDLEIVGVGYRFSLKGNKLVINAGFSHPVEKEIPTGIKVDVKSNTELTISGYDKIQVGEFAAIVRKVKEPEPYKGKGIRYVNEHVKRKEGKKAK